MKKAIALLLCSFYLQHITLNAGLCPAYNLQTLSQNICILPQEGVPVLIKPQITTLFHEALYNNDLDTIAYILRTHVDDINRQVPTTGETFLHRAAETGHSKVITILLKLGANTDIKNKQGETPLHLAVKNGSLKSIKKLLRAGANPLIHNDEKPIALHNARGHEKRYAILKTFIQELSNKPNILEEVLSTPDENSNGLTPLQVLPEKGLATFLVMLIEHLKDKHTELLCRLLNTYNLPHSPNTLLHRAGYLGFETVFLSLIENLKDKDLIYLNSLLAKTNQDNNTPLHLVAYSKLNTVFKSLRDTFQVSQPHFLKKLLSIRNNYHYTPLYVLKDAPYPSGVEPEDCQIAPSWLYVLYNYLWPFSYKKQGDS